MKRLDGKVAIVELARVAGTVDIRGELFGAIRLAELQADARIRSKNGELRFAALPGEIEVKVRSVSGSRMTRPGPSRAGRVQSCDDSCFRVSSRHLRFPRREVASRLDRRRPCPQEPARPDSGHGRGSGRPRHPRLWREPADRLRMAT